ncbi:unnamed protein product [Ranitomeya imitator]|uniref:Uncharacterized protein n=1 Tax=Ranitomeya imitator TaxID=111125 RepID=A0ABN9KTU2_9NEOB|nr:unnamed protein product [Ranitomeya imitator]
MGPSSARLSACGGLPDIDLFAARKKRKVEQFCSLNSRENPVMVDAFLRKWDFNLAYAFPALSLLPLVVRKIREDRFLDDRVVLRPDPAYLPKVASDFHRSQEIVLPSFLPNPASQRRKRSFTPTEMSDEEIREKTLRTAAASLEGKTPVEKTSILHQHIGRREMTDMIIETIGPSPVVQEVSSTEKTDDPSETPSQTTPDSPSKQLPEQITFFSGNPSVEIVHGIMHLYKTKRRLNVTTETGARGPGRDWYQGIGEGLVPGDRGGTGTRGSGKDWCQGTGEGLVPGDRGGTGTRGSGKDWCQGIGEGLVPGDRGRTGARGPGKDWCQGTGEGLVPGDRGRTGARGPGKDWCQGTGEGLVPGDRGRTGARGPGRDWCQGTGEGLVPGDRGGTGARGPGRDWCQGTGEGLVPGDRGRTGARGPRKDWCQGTGEGLVPGDRGRTGARGPGKDWCQGTGEGLVPEDRGRTGARGPGKDWCQGTGEGLVPGDRGGTGARGPGRDCKMTSLKEDVRRSAMICILTVPAAMTSHDLMKFVAPFNEVIEHMKIIRDSTPNQYMVLIKFSEQADADSFYMSNNGRQFNSIEEDVCQLVYVERAEVFKSEDGASLPVMDLTELPKCTVCLERMDESVNGILTTLCNHSFHSQCLQRWEDTTCPVCRYCQTPEPVEENKCFECGVQENLWICLICGHIGCGRYVSRHAYKHFEETQHTYAMQLTNHRVWDYAGGLISGIYCLINGVGPSVVLSRSLVDTQQLSKEKRVAIITLRNEGPSLRKIGKTLKVSPSAVAKTIKHYRETGSHEDRPRKGRPRVTSASEDKIFRVTSLRDRRLTAAQIRDQVNATQSSSSRHISTTTVKWRLCAAGLHGKIAAKKPLLRTGNKQKTLVWTKEHKEWTLDQWKSVLWSDESKFEIFGSNHRVFVRRRKGERMDSTCLVPTVKHGGGGVGDNDVKHTSRLCKGYLTKKESGGVLRQMTWPLQSPDLNPIEMRNSGNASAAAAIFRSQDALRNYRDDLVVSRDR